MSMSTRAMALVLLGSLVAVSGGCGPSTLLETPPDWPEAWSGRTLYHTPRAYVYASSREACGEADRLVATVAREFKAEHDRDVTEGLVIITDVDDERILGDFETLFELAQRDRPSEESDGIKTEEELREELADIKAQMDELGLELNMVLDMSAIPLPPEVLTGLLEMPAAVAETTPWAVAVSTRALLAASNHKLVKASLESSDVGPLGRAAVAPLLAAAEPAMVDMLLATREAAVFTVFVRSQPDWSAERKREIVDAYVKRKMKQGTEKLEAATSRPAGPLPGASP